MGYEILNIDEAVQVEKLVRVQEWKASTGNGWAKTIPLTDYDKMVGATLRIVTGSSDYKYCKNNEGAIQHNFGWRENCFLRVAGTKTKYRWMAENGWSEETITIDKIQDCTKHYIIGGVK